MKVKTIRSEGLAHNSYIVSDGSEMAIVDPARDVDRYLDHARHSGCKITLVFETHRNEDYVSGAAELKTRTNAQVWRGHSPDYAVPYARTVSEGQIFEFGSTRFQALHTPGHTDDSISISVVHQSTGNDPVGVFTGDALFIGDVGRTDFYPERAREVAGLLYDSIHRKLLPLGDQAALFPAHGSGSVCGSGIVDRDFSTLGYERKNNPRLRLGREDFIAAKVAEQHYQPPYFRRMEQANLGDGAELSALPPGWPMEVAEFRDRAANTDAQVLDLRNDQAIAGGCLPRSFSIPIDMLASFGGWFLDWTRPILLVLEHRGDYERAARILARMSYDRLEGILSGGFEAWSTSGAPVESIRGIDVHTLKTSLAGNNPPLVLDVRSSDEFASGHIEGARNIYVGEIEQKIGDIPPDRHIVTLCASGRRALVAAAALKRLGRSDVDVCWGSMKAWKHASYPTVDAQAHRS
jgi:hydroxyacylglutathione hydrolase